MTLTQRLTEILDTIFDQGMCYDLADEPDKFHDECIKSNLTAILTAIRTEVEGLPQHPTKELNTFANNLAEQIEQAYDNGYNQAIDDVLDLIK